MSRARPPERDPARARLRRLGHILVAGGVLAVGPLWAQAQRDPTVAPAQAASASAGTAGAASALDGVPFAVIVREGRPFLVVGTRLYAQGQLLGSARIERIAETEVWLREGKTLRRHAVFNGIERRPAGATPPAPPCPPPAARAKAAARNPKSDSCPP